jgi:4-amino-4-deoxy-L-arabinose transferase-like glycosyltransferase
VQSSWKAQLLLLGIAAAALMPFLDKAFHIDDPLFLWMAQQITKHPIDPYGFSVNWSTSPEPMWKVMQNPPLCSYYIAAISLFVGWSERAMHLAFLIWPILSILATFAIARRFCRVPLMAALFTLFTPVFLISATNIMCDVMLLALWLWSIECWIAGLERQRWSLLALSAVLATAAALTKYFGISVVPLLAAYTIARDRSLAGYVVWLLIPVAALVAFELSTKAHYGIGLFGGAVDLSRTMAKFRPPVAQFLTGLAFTGGCLITALFYLPRRQWRFWMIVIISIIAFLAFFYFFVPLRSVFALGQNSTLVWIEGGIFATIGAGILALGIADSVHHRDASSVLLLLWLGGTFSFATFCNWSITGRTILPMAPAAAILLTRSWERDSSPLKHSFLCYARVFLAAAVSTVLTAVDYWQAKTAQDASREFQRRFESELSTIWLESHWGFQFYMQKWGAIPLNAANSEITSGDVIIFPSNNSSIIPLPMERIFPPETVTFPTLPFASTHGRGTGAAFYSSARGPLPWAIDRVPPETYYVARFR